MLDTFDACTERICMNVTILICCALANRLEFRHKPGAKIELEGDPFASCGVEMHEGLVNLLN